jgi:hypothetical protein
MPGSFDKVKQQLKPQLYFESEICFFLSNSTFVFLMNKFHLFKCDKNSALAATLMEPRSQPQTQPIFTIKLGHFKVQTIFS